MPPKGILLDERAKELLIMVLMIMLLSHLNLLSHVFPTADTGGRVVLVVPRLPLVYICFFTSAYLESKFTKCSWNGCVNTQSLGGLKFHPIFFLNRRSAGCYSGHFPHSHLFVYRKSFHIATKIEKENKE